MLYQHFVADPAFKITFPPFPLSFHLSSGQRHELKPVGQYALCLLFQMVEYQLPYYFVISMKHMHLCLVAFGSDLKKGEK